jgi:beta-mannosidase
MEHHQRYPRGNSLITEAFTRYFRFPEGFDSFVYLSQVQQALAIKEAVEYWRHLRPACMGALYWQLDDTWPVCSWSSIEYGGRWKLLHYAARRFFAPVLLAAHPAGDRVEVWLTSDLRETARCGVELRVIDFRGAAARKEGFTVTVPPGSVRLLKSYAAAELAPRPERAFLHLRLTRGGESFENGMFFCEPKRCELAPAEVRAGVSQTSDGFAVSVSTDAPAFFVSLDVEEVDGEFEDNCFILLPSEPRIITFSPRRRTSLSRVRRSLRVRHLRGTYR